MGLCFAQMNAWLQEWKLKYDMILGGIFNIWRYLTHSPPLRPCTAGLDVAKTRRLGVTCSRINSSSGNYGITSSNPQLKALIPTQWLPKSVNTSKMGISTTVLPNFKVYSLFSLLSSIAYTFAGCYSIVSEVLCKFLHIFLTFQPCEMIFTFKEIFSWGKCCPKKTISQSMLFSNLIQMWFKK